MRRHKVKQGECLSTIAARYGFGDAMWVWNHPSNARLKEQRGDGNILFPGDEIVIPDRSQKKKLTLKAGEHKQIQVQLPKRKLSLLLVDGKGAPRANADYRLRAGSEELSGKTDGSGRLEQMLPVEVQTATLMVGKRTWELEIGHLNPVMHIPEEDVSGVEAMLKNLGLYTERVCGFATETYRQAVRTAQHWLGHEETGHASEEFKKDLLDIYHGQKMPPPPVSPPVPSEVDEADEEEENESWMDGGWSATAQSSLGPALIAPGAGSPFGTADRTGVPSAVPPGAPSVPQAAVSGVGLSGMPGMASIPQPGVPASGLRGLPDTSAAMATRPSTVSGSGMRGVPDTSSSAAKAAVPSTVGKVAPPAAVKKVEAKKGAAKKTKGKKKAKKKAADAPPPWHPGKVTQVEKLPEPPELCSQHSKKKAAAESDKHPVATGILNTLGVGRKGTCEACKTYEDCLDNNYNFLLAVAEMAERLKGDASNFMAIMHFETGHSFDPAIVNEDVKNKKGEVVVKGSGATGLIQIMPSTAPGLGTTTADLRKMCRLDQLRYVELYFQKIKAQYPHADFRKLCDVVLAVFEPVGLNPKHKVLGASNEKCEGGSPVYVDRKGKETAVTQEMLDYYKEHGELKKDRGVLRDPKGELIGIHPSTVSYWIDYDGEKLLVTPHLRAVYKGNSGLARTKPGFILREDYAGILADKIVPGCGKKSCEKAAELQKGLASTPAEYLLEVK